MTPSRRNLSEVSSKVYPSLERVPGKQNWVDKAGGLPSYIERIAKHLHYEGGRPIGAAIAMAVSTVKKWCATGRNHNGSNVKADTQAKACAAVASWEKKKAKSKLKESVEMREALELLESQAPEMTDEEAADLAGRVKARLLVAEGMLPALQERNCHGKGELVDRARELLEADLSTTVAIGMLGGRHASPSDQRKVREALEVEIADLRALGEALGVEEASSKGDLPESQKTDDIASLSAYERAKRREKKKMAESEAAANAEFSEEKHPRAPKGSPDGGQFSTVGKGDSGNLVTGAQSALGMEDPSGNFDKATEQAVREYQEENGLQVDGVIGSQTAASMQGREAEVGELSKNDKRWLRRQGRELTETLKRGSEGKMVKRLQEGLIDAGIFVGDAGADGKFEAETEKGVKALQRRRGQEPSGEADPAFRATLSPPEWGDLSEAGLRKLRSIDLPDLNAVSRGRVNAEIKRLPDGTFAPKGMGRVLRAGDDVSLGGVAGKVEADGRRIKLDDGKELALAPEAQAPGVKAPPSKPTIDKPDTQAADISDKLEKDNAEFQTALDRYNAEQENPDATYPPIAGMPGTGGMRSPAFDEGERDFLKRHFGLDTIGADLPESPADLTPERRTEWAASLERGLRNNNLARGMADRPAATSALTKLSGKGMRSPAWDAVDDSEASNYADLKDKDTWRDMAADDINRADATPEEIEKRAEELWDNWEPSDDEIYRAQGMLSPGTVHTTEDTTLGNGYEIPAGSRLAADSVANASGPESLLPDRVRVNTPAGSKLSGSDLTFERSGSTWSVHGIRGYGGGGYAKGSPEERAVPADSELHEKLEQTAKATADLKGMHSPEGMASSGGMKSPGKVGEPYWPDHDGEYFAMVNDSGADPAADEAVKEWIDDRTANGPVAWADLGVDAYDTAVRDEIFHYLGERGLISDIKDVAIYPEEWPDPLPEGQPSDGSILLKPIRKGMNSPGSDLPDDTDLPTFLAKASDSELDTLQKGAVPGGDWAEMIGKEREDRQKRGEYAKTSFDRGMNSPNLDPEVQGRLNKKIHATKTDLEKLYPGGYGADKSITKENANWTKIRQLEARLKGQQTMVTIQGLKTELESLYPSGYGADKSITSDNADWDRIRTLEGELADQIDTHDAARKAENFYRFKGDLKSKGMKSYADDPDAAYDAWREDQAEAEWAERQKKLWAERKPILDAVKAQGFGEGLSDEALWNALPPDPQEVDKGLLPDGPYAPWSPQAPSSLRIDHSKLAPTAPPLYYPTKVGEGYIEKQWIEDIGKPGEEDHVETDSFEWIWKDGEDEYVWEDGSAAHTWENEEGEEIFRGSLDDLWDELGDRIANYSEEDAKRLDAEKAVRAEHNRRKRVKDLIGALEGAPEGYPSYKGNSLPEELKDILLGDKDASTLKAGRPSYRMRHTDTDYQEPIQELWDDALSRRRYSAGRERDALAGMQREFEARREGILPPFQSREALDEFRLKAKRLGNAAALYDKQAEVLWDFSRQLMPEPQEGPRKGPGMHSPGSRPYIDQVGLLDQLDDPDMAIAEGIEQVSEGIAGRSAVIQYGNDRFIVAGEPEKVAAALERMTTGRGDVSPEDVQIRQVAGIPDAPAARKLDAVHTITSTDEFGNTYRRPLTPDDYAGMVDGMVVDGKQVVIPPRNNGMRSPMSTKESRAADRLLRGETVNLGKVRITPEDNPTVHYGELAVQPANPNLPRPSKPLVAAIVGHAVEGLAGVEDAHPEELLKNGHLLAEYAGLVPEDLNPDMPGMKSPGIKPNTESLADHFHENSTALEVEQLPIGAYIADAAGYPYVLHKALEKKDGTVDFYIAKPVNAAGEIIDNDPHPHAVKGVGSKAHGPTRRLFYHRFAPHSVGAVHPDYAEDVDITVDGPPPVAVEAEKAVAAGESVQGAVAMATESANYGQKAFENGSPAWSEKGNLRNITKMKNEKFVDLWEQMKSFETIDEKGFKAVNAEYGRRQGLPNSDPQSLNADNPGLVSVDLSGKVLKSNQQPKPTVDGPEPKPVMPTTDKSKMPAPAQLQGWQLLSHSPMLGPKGNLRNVGAMKYPKLMNLGLEMTSTIGPNGKTWADYHPKGFAALHDEMVARGFSQDAAALRTRLKEATGTVWPVLTAPETKPEVPKVEAGKVSYPSDEDRRNGQSLINHFVENTNTDDLASLEQLPTDVTDQLYADLDPGKVAVLAVGAESNNFHEVSEKAFDSLSAKGYALQDIYDMAEKYGEPDSLPPAVESPARGPKGKIRNVGAMSDAKLSLTAQQMQDPIPGHPDHIWADADPDGWAKVKAEANSRGIMTLSSNTTGQDFADEHPVQSVSGSPEPPAKAPEPPAKAATPGEGEGSLYDALTKSVNAGPETEIQPEDIDGTWGNEPGSDQSYGNPDAHWEGDQAGSTQTYAVSDSPARNGSDGSLVDFGQMTDQGLYELAGQMVTANPDGSTWEELDPDGFEAIESELSGRVIGYDYNDLIDGKPLPEPGSQEEDAYFTKTNEQLTAVVAELPAPWDDASVEQALQDLQAKGIDLDLDEESPQTIAAILKATGSPPAGKGMNSPGYQDADGPKLSSQIVHGDWALVDEVENVRTYEQEGMLGGGRGLVVNGRDGGQQQLSFQGGTDEAQAKLEEDLAQSIEGGPYEPDDLYDDYDMRTFDEAGVMTYNEGVVFTDRKTGEEIQMTIVRSKDPDPDYFLNPTGSRENFGPGMASPGEYMAPVDSKPSDILDQGELATLIKAAGEQGLPAADYLEDDEMPSGHRLDHMADVISRTGDPDAHKAAQKLKSWDQTYWDPDNMSRAELLKALGLERSDLADYELADMLRGRREGGS